MSEQLTTSNPPLLNHLIKLILFYIVLQVITLLININLPSLHPGGLPWLPFVLALSTLNKNHQQLGLQKLAVILMLYTATVLATDISYMNEIQEPIVYGALILNYTFVITIYWLFAAALHKLEQSDKYKQWQQKNKGTNNVLIRDFNAYVMLIAVLLIIALPFIILNA